MDTNKPAGEIVILNGEGYEQTLVQHPDFPTSNPPEKPGVIIVSGRFELIRRFDHEGTSWLVIRGYQRYGWPERHWIQQTTAQPEALIFTGKIGELDDWGERR
jgi:hypothetical protein